MKIIITESQFKLIKENLQYKTLYRGTDHELDFTKNNMVWVAEDVNVASGYGNHVYELTVDVGNCFDSLDLGDIQSLYDRGIKINDPYRDDSEDDYDEDYDEEGYVTAEAFLDNCSSDTWEAIEQSGIISIIKDRFESIFITEGGDRNYILFKSHEQIKNFKKIK